MKSTSAVALAGVYFIYFAIVGITLPFLPSVLRDSGMSASQVGVLLALGPLVSLVVPQYWSRWADRTGRPELALRAVTLGAPLAFAGLFVSHSLGSLALTFVAYAAFSTAVIPLLDTLTLTHAELGGARYARLRLFGSLGFAIAAFLFGLTAPHSRVGFVGTALALMIVNAACAWVVPRSAARPSSVASSPWGLLTDGPLRWVLAATTLHWIANSPFNVTFALHVADIGFPAWVVGVTASLGVLAEMLMFAAYPKLEARLTARVLLVAACAISAIRWLLVSVIREPIWLTTLSLLHSFTFGAFYASAISLVVQRVPSHQRAAGQALFIAVTFGLGGLVGYASAGLGYQVLGGALLFQMAAATDAVAALLARGVRTTAPR
ncbi:MAG: MFS transporter [Myxococcaceae bacterium]